MASCVNDNSDVNSLLQQLAVARNEINNLRQQVRSLGFNHQREVEHIQRLVKTWQCPTCRETASGDNAATPSTSAEDVLTLRPIGVISTWFPEKKGTPRQPGICVTSQGKLTLFNTVFTNPEHALDGLNGFSHMWILFHFHKNETGHVRAKVSPPRLNGIRTGVFGTRSPHRPSPIGLSLVSIDQVDGACVYFSGVDMVDGTPVLDIKPYIPQYDSPLPCNNVPVVRTMDGREADREPIVVAPPAAERLAEGQGRMGEREAPDGEEGAMSTNTATTTSSSAGGGVVPLGRPVVRVPEWISQPPVSKLNVTFSDRARAQLESITRDSESVDGPLNAIRSVLREDPRSVYLRERWGNQFYTFLICNLHVTCKFDDAVHNVTVFQVRSAGKICDCGQLEWQCSVHGDSSE